ncbi:MAG: class I SAM-dependent methyltransferase [Candidatus Jettenia sp.]|nr:class I SAM-dependent methyltransferase [Candidatus Jettenia sp.]
MTAIRNLFKKFIVEQYKHILDDLPPLYHRYDAFGVENKQMKGPFVLNQVTKTPIITAYIALALAILLKENIEPTFAELFAGDGYYAMLAARLGAKHSFAIDNNRDGYSSHVNVIAERLGVSNFGFIDGDIVKLTTLPDLDIIANVGGLYHVDNPQEILEMSYEKAQRFLVLQNVVSMDSKSPSYYMSPAPGWTWGNRYSRESFDKLIKKLKYKVLLQDFNELQGNPEPQHRGSVYYLIEK